MSVANYTSPIVLIPDDAVGIDFEIGKLQEIIKNSFSFLDTVFGRCTIQREVMKQTDDKKTRSKEYVFPQVLTFSGESMNVLPNDNLKGYCFFIVHDPGEFPEYNPYMTQNFLERKVSLVVWYNMARIEPNRKHPLNELYMIELVKKLKMTNFIFGNVYEEYRQVFKEFTIDENFRQYMRFPFCAFRIDGTITYPISRENCQ